ncbi:hypothetical protein [Acrocarpospora catenulata]|uniref:hypothetical protein n=1 Tax=Acrocarpospora catenulata TaxID=2836182 RepID=UPI001BDABACA|nr:hypothetical protein [Acrocarpospora catenulata]
MRTRIALLALALATASGTALSATPASAAVCATLGHAYFIYPADGFNYMSGFENDKRYGVPTIFAFRGSFFQVGGNGIKPGTPITFTAVTGMFGANSGAVTTNAGGNCVVNQVPNAFAIGNVPNGTYTVRATYRAGNSGAFIVNEPVVRVAVVG